MKYERTRIPFRVTRILFKLTTFLVKQNLVNLNRIMIGSGGVRTKKSNDGLSREPLVLLRLNVQRKVPYLATRIDSERSDLIV